jgi:hypothetical protein
MQMYAERTEVPVSKSRNQIDTLLREWGCDGIQWTDEFTTGRVTLRFAWTPRPKKNEPTPVVTYWARFDITVPNDEALKKRAIHRRTYQFSAAKYAVLQRDRGKQEHRLLLLWLKAAFAAIDAGVIPAELLFLAWLEGRDGQTVGQRALPQLTKLLSAPSADAVLMLEQKRD